MHIRDGISLSLRKCVFPRASSLSSRNRRNSRAGEVPRSGIAEFHALERSITRKLQNPTRWNGLSLGNREIPRAGEVHRSGIEKSHAQERSIAQESQNPTRGNEPAPKNRIFSRASSTFLL